MKCKFCGEDRHLIEAHIIPRGLFKRIDQGKGTLRMVTNRDGEFTKRTPTGVYDKTIVCARCEQLWQKWDDYAQKLLGDKPLDGDMRYASGRHVCYVLHNIDYVSLKLFFISLLWRASVSSQPFYSKVSIGEYERQAKDHLESSNPGSAEDFAVILAKFDHPLAKSILDPHPDTIGGVHFIRFYLTDYIAYIKVDCQGTPELFSGVILAEGKPLFILCRNFEKSGPCPVKWCK